MSGLRLLVVLGLLLLLLHAPKGLFEELGRVFTVGTLEPHGVDLNGSVRSYDDFDGLFHDGGMVWWWMVFGGR